jgi:hypothetical protein
VSAWLACPCKCADGGYAPDPTLYISGRLYVYNGPYASLAGQPFDGSVISEATAIAHEWEWHINIGIARVDSIIKELERRGPFTSQNECQETCRSFSDWVNYQFASVVGASQTLERDRRDPRVNLP